jgi:hypothetical protein
VNIEVRVVPGARRSEVLGEADGVLRVRVAAPAVDGKANIELARVLAAHYGVKPRDVSIERGMRHRTKLVTIAGMPTSSTDAAQSKRRGR